MTEPSNIGKRRAAAKDVTHTTRSSRVTKPRETTTTTTKEPAVKKAASKASTTKAAPKKADTSTMAPAVKKTTKRSAEEDVSPPPKRSKATTSTTTSKKAAPKPAAATKKPSTKAAPAKKVVTTEPKPAKATKEAPRPAAKKLVAKKSPAETRKEQHDINAIPTERLWVFACGEGTAGELGLGPKGKEVKRPRVNNLLDPEKVGIVQLDAGGMHVVALTHDSKILTWGVNDLGALGRDTTWEAPTRELGSGEDSDSDADSDDADMNPHESTPTAVDASYFPPGTKFVQVAAGDSCSFALTSTGLVYGWGTFRDINGVYGFTLDEYHNIIKEVHRPKLIQKLKNITAISAGADYALALDKDGLVYAWGCGQQDQLGRRIVDRRRKEALLPTVVGIKKKIKIAAIFAGSNHAFALDQDKNVYAWGLNNYGQTGIATSAGEGNSTITAPTKLEHLDGRNIKELSGGGHHSVAVSEDGTCYVFGRMDSYQMGLDFDTLPLQDKTKVLLDEREKPRILLQPTAIPNILFSQVSAGSSHNVGISTDGRAYSWGFSPTYQCGQGDEDEIKVATLIDNKALRDRTMIWAGAGGQYSVFASNLAEPTASKV